MFKSSIKEQLLYLKTGKVFYVPNIYGSSEERVDFEDGLITHDFLRSRKLILVDDLSFTIKTGKIWMNATIIYPLSYFFLNMIAMDVLVDVEPIKLIPAWRNTRTRDERGEIC